MITNIVKASFGSSRSCVTQKIYEYDENMKLQFVGLDLPAAYRVDFSNNEESGNAIQQIGDETGVSIPYDLFLTGLPIYAFLVLENEGNGMRTTHKVTIPIAARPTPTNIEPTPSEQTVIEQAISALNSAVEQTAADVETTAANAQAAAQSEANASASERAAAASASAALASQNAAESAAQSATESASGASELARNAAVSASAAAESATAAQASAEQAERSVQSITDDVERSERAAQTATDKATEAASSASFAASAAQNAAESEQAAESHATDAETAKQDAQDAKEAAEQAQAAAEQASEDAESAADRAEQAEQEVLSSMDGTYENLTSGNAQQLLSTVTESDSVPYLFRPTAENADRAYLDEIVGGTVALNQLAENGNFADTTQWAANSQAYGTFTVNNNVATFVVGASSVGNTSTYFRNNAVKQLKDHVLLGSISVYPPRSTTFRFSYPAAASGTRSQRCNANTWSNVANVIKANSDTNGAIFYYNVSADIQEGDTILFKNALVFDLTVMFGTTIADYIYNLETVSAGAGVAYFRKLFPKDYYEFNKGELLSVEGVSAKRTVGFNLFDLSQFAELYPTICTMSDGELNCVANASLFTTGVPVDNVFSDTQQYYVTVELKAGTATNVRLRLAYEDGGYQELGGTNSTTYIKYSALFSRQKKLVAVRLNWTQAGTFSVRNLCINLSDPTRNGTYEPYTERTYPLDSSLTLRGVPKLDASGKLYYDGDTYAADGTVTRRFKKIVLDGVNQLFTASWGSATNGYAVYKTVADIDSNGMPLVLTDKFVNSNLGYNQMPEWSVGRNNGAATTVTFLFPSTITSTAEANNWLKNNNVTMIYPVATPTTETATPYRHLQICDPNGTEEFVSTGIVPVGHNTRYPENLRAKIEGLPWNFNAIIAMTETTTTASKAYSVGDYFIYANTLYRVTSAIAAGGTITIGTNCRATTIMDEIKALS